MLWPGELIRSRVFSWNRNLSQPYWVHILGRRNIKSSKETQTSLVRWFLHSVYHVHLCERILPLAKWNSDAIDPRFLYKRRGQKFLLSFLLVALSLVLNWQLGMTAVGDRTVDSIANACPPLVALLVYWFTVPIRRQFASAEARFCKRNRRRIPFLFLSSSESHHPR